MDTVTIGRTVWTKFDGETVPATVTKVWTDGTINATVFNTDGTFGTLTRAEWSDTTRDQMWTWPTFTPTATTTTADTTTSKTQ